MLFRSGTSREELAAIMDMEIEDHLIPSKESNKTSEEKKKLEKKKVQQVTQKDKLPHSSITPTVAEFKKGQDIKSQFVRTIDGDTIEFIMGYEDKLGVGSQKATIRLLGLDTPEISNNEPYAEEAKQYVNNLLANAKSITLDYEDEIGRAHV